MTSSVAGHGHADTDLHRAGAAQNLKWPVHLRQDAFGNHLEVRRGQDVLHQNSKLIAAEARGGILRPQTGAQAVRQRNQQHVARSVAEGRIDGLEVIEIEIQHSATVATARPAAQRESDAVLEQSTVR